MDLIDRQAAIKAVNQYISQFDAIDVNFLDGLKTAINIVMNLPSALECKYWDSESCFCALHRPSAQERIDAAYKEGYCDCEQEWLKERRQERKKGKWIIDEHDPERDTKCSSCGFVLDDWVQGVFYNFCPNCGADMREETEDAGL